MRRAFKYRIWTNANQERELEIALETHRRLYNSCLEQRKNAYEAEQRSVKYPEQSAWFKVQRATNSYFARLNFSSAQATMRRLDKAYQAFFRRVKAGEKPGYPRFKSRDHFDSFTFPSYRDGIRLTGSKLYAQYVGTLRVKLHRPVDGDIKTVTLKREADKWYVIFTCEVATADVTPSTLPPIGVDVGLTHFLTTSEGTTEANPRYLKAVLPKLRREQRSLARKRKGSNRRRKQKRRVSRLHQKVKNARREHHYAVACRLVLAYGLIAVESLNIQGMLRSHRFSRAIADAAWGGFVSILKHKAAKAGAQVVEVDPKGTSQRCSECSTLVVKDVTVRWHDCHHCGLSLGRDLNAARNILIRGLAGTRPAEGNVD